MERGLLYKEDKWGVGTSKEDSTKWKFIWSLNIPNKIKIFCWRACSDILPTGNRLISKRLKVTNMCAVCGLEGESLYHVLRQCSFARKVWALCSFNLYKEVSGCDSILWWWKDVRERVDTEEFEVFVTLCWGLWNNRNVCLFAGAQHDALDLYSSTTDLLRQYKNAQIKAPYPSLMTPINWQTPLENRYKINFDAALFTRECAIGVGVVVRGNKGNFYAGLSKKITGSLTPENAEALAASEAVFFGLECGFRDVTIEGDATNVISALRHEGENLSEIGNVIEEAKEMCKNFHRSDFSLVRRTGNRVAHKLAQYARILDNYCVWMEEAPEFVKSAIQDDVPQNF